ncbi:MAG: hypothetical protein Q7R32_09360 [Dehalococcoidia bacterium]|nr:hypothetical protein [Dehalococcoidia bacterium]
MVYDVAFIRRYGDTPEGQDWDGFMNEQRNTLNGYAEKGWKLVAVSPMIRSVMEGSTLGGVLLYFASQGE